MKIAKKEIYALCANEDITALKSLLDGVSPLECLEPFDEDLYRYHPDCVQWIITKVVNSGVSTSNHDYLFMDFFLQLNFGSSKAFSDDQLGENIYKLLVRLGGAEEVNTRKEVIPFTQKESLNFIENMNFLLEKLPYSSQLWNKSIPESMHSAAFFEKIFWIYDHNPSAQASGYSQYTNDWYVPEYLDEVLVTARTMFGKGSLQQKLINELPVKSVFIKKSKL